MSINRLSEYQFAISQSISGSFNTNDTVEASFLAKGNSSVTNQYVTQFVDLKYSVSSESISLQEFPKGTFPEQFFIGSSYTTQSFTAGIPEEIQYVEFTLTGSLIYFFIRKFLVAAFLFIVLTCSILRHLGKVLELFEIKYFIEFSFKNLIRFVSFSEL